MNYQMSDSIKEITSALVKVQGLIESAKKSSDNPFFKSKYADLTSCIEVSRKHLVDNGIAVIQIPTSVDGVSGLLTMLAHSSGEWIRGFLPMVPTKDTPQAIGSAITYARRYALSAMVGIATEDDDGNSASEKKPTNIESKLDALPDNFKCSFRDLGWSRRQVIDFCEENKWHKTKIGDKLAGMFETKKVLNDDVTGSILE